MRQPKHMISKFRGVCDTCGRDIETGETIYWKSRGIVDCVDCAPPDGIQPKQPKQAAKPAQPQQPAQSAPSSNAWSDALAWNAAPAPGESIKANKPAMRITPPPAPAPVAAGNAAVDIQPSSRVVPISRDNAPETAPDNAPFTLIADNSDLAVSILHDQLIGLVNAICKLECNQIEALRAQMEQLQDTRDFTRKHCFIKLAELLGA